MKCGSAQPRGGALSQSRRSVAGGPVQDFSGGDLLEFNPPLIEMLGYPEGSSPQRVNLAEVWLRPDERARLKAMIDREGVVKNFAMELRRPDGSVIWCEQSARAIYDATGEILHYEGVLVDITSRKRAEEEANRARDKVRDLALKRRACARNSWPA